jgi:hypothetical protein
MLRSEKAGEKICKKGLDNSGNIEGILKHLFAPVHRYAPLDSVPGFP